MNIVGPSDHHWSGDLTAVDVDAVGAAKVGQDELAVLEAKLTVMAGNVAIGQDQVTVLIAANDDRVAREDARVVGTPRLCHRYYKHDLCRGCILVLRQLQRESK